MNYSQTKSIKVSDITHKHLSRLGRKGESYDLIIARLIQEHLAFDEMPKAIEGIKEICGDKKASEFIFSSKVIFTEDVFNQINFDKGIYPDWDVSKALETAMDEDLVESGAAHGDRELLMSEVVIKCYCLYLEMPFPTMRLK